MITPYQRVVGAAALTLVNAFSFVALLEFVGDWILPWSTLFWHGPLLALALFLSD